MSRDPILPDSLPQYGFGSEFEFKTIVQNNAFLFRVHTPKSPNQSVVFQALKYDGRFTPNECSPAANPPVPTYADVVQHMDWTTRHSSAYISASLSFMWAIWEALRRYHLGVKHDVEIAVIDATALADRAVTIVELMRSIPPAKRHKNHWKWYQFAQESQSVLIYGSIPPTAVLASVPILRILESLPSYCLSSHTSPPSLTPVHGIHSWAHIIQKPSFRKYCETLSDNFLRMPPDARFSDATLGAVTLSLAFLNKWFDWMLHLDPPCENEDDPEIFRRASATKISELARAIAVWPASSDTLQAWDAVTRDIAALIAAEVAARVHTVVPHNPKKRWSAAFSDVASLPDICAAAAEESLPAILDPRNYLPTPPPTPPPLAVERVPSAAASCRTTAACVSRAAGGDVTTAEKHEDSNSPKSPSSSPDAPEFDSDTMASSASHSATAAPLEAKSSPASSLLSGETASCLFTGFLFGALLIVALSQRRTTLVHLS